MLSKMFRTAVQLIVIFAVVLILIMSVLWMSGYYKPDFLKPDSSQVNSDYVTSDSDYVYLGGQSIGVSIDVEDVLVTGLEEIETEDGKKVNPGLKAGLQIGDVIIAIDGTEVKTASDVHKIIEKTDKDKVRLKVGRKGELVYVDITPVKSAKEGVYRLGLWVKEKTAGIGTLTFYNEKTGMFGALGHGIIDAQSGKILSIADGQLLDARIISLKEGKKGKPGELQGIFYEADEPLGRLEKNLSIGIYGVAYEKLSNSLYPNPVPVAEAEEIKEGAAVILTTVSGDKVKEYDIEIEDITYKNKHGENKDMIIKVTDEELLSESGGIIQGMSGSPIIQNGKLVGAVTHVLVNDPARGYGIFIENMLEAAK